MTKREFKSMCLTFGLFSIIIVIIGYGITGALIIITAN